MMEMPESMISIQEFHLEYILVTPVNMMARKGCKMDCTWGLMVNMPGSTVNKMGM